LANEIEAASISVTTLTSSRLAGADTVMIFGLVPTFVDHIVSVVEHHGSGAAQGKKRRRQSTGEHLGPRFAAGIEEIRNRPGQDVKILPTGHCGEIPRRSQRE